MKTGSSKIFIQIDSNEQQENIRNKKSLKTFKDSSDDKENLQIIGRPLKPLKIHENEMTSEFKKKKVTNKAVQTDSENSSKITANDLTSEAGPSEHYWEMIAEKRRQALDETLEENRKLHEKIELLEEENKTCKEMLQESKNLVEILTEMLEEKDSTEAAEEAIE
ncbi:geminin [Chrysoperla carnea]|uniref:geminin n=1 Tax=Chrysoperla carnea TaxID=189513 RepID=UPI001D06A024|nr:geminin [Chrysoperla carnea]